MAYSSWDICAMDIDGTNNTCNYDVMMWSLYSKLQ